MALKLHSKTTPKSENIAKSLSRFWNWNVSRKNTCHRTHIERDFVCKKTESAPHVISMHESILTLSFANPISDALPHSNVFVSLSCKDGICYRQQPHLLSLCPQNFSQKSYNQKSCLLKIKINKTIGFAEKNPFSLFRFFSILFTSITHLHLNTGIFHHGRNYCTSLGFPIFSLNGITFLSLLFFKLPGCFSLPLCLPSMHRILPIL